jgi:hypothetical protein
MPENESNIGGVIADVLLETLVSENVEDCRGESANVVDALGLIGQALKHGFYRLGTADAATSMGAIEAHAAAVKEAAEDISGALKDVAEAGYEIAESLREIARAIKHRKEGVDG